MDEATYYRDHWVTSEPERLAVSDQLYDWPEPIVDGKIDLGPFIYETLATSLDPYPRKQGVSFDWSQGAPGQGGSGSGPFAALVGLKRR